MSSIAARAVVVISLVAVLSWAVRSLARAWRLVDHMLDDAPPPVRADKEMADSTN
ncbi:hypothetical protein AB0J80_18720 [Actinoplanes sp. NPDC049548]|uniref:hypothetical protein n=1 Tax=Actinoplanes sp. NPDC049548 TaxID=3155152 RepID=UPI003418E713